jgi:hypothetical protein
MVHDGVGVGVVVGGGDGVGEGADGVGVGADGVDDAAGDGLGDGRPL